MKAHYHIRSKITKYQYPAMQASKSFRHAFLKKMLLGLKLSGVSSKRMSLLERKRAIKLSADIAMAFARGSTTWSRALIANLCKQENNNGIVKSILGKNFERLSKPSLRGHNISRSKKILRRSFQARQKTKKGVRASPGTPSSLLARNLVKKRIQVLKRLVPGGESLNDLSVLTETLDYVTSLQAQVDLLQRLTKVLNDVPNLNPHSPSPHSKIDKPYVS